MPFVATYRDPAYPRRRCAASRAPATSTATSRWCRTRSAASPRTRSARSPSTSTAHNADIPEDVIGGLAEIGTFGLSVPEEYGGFATGGEGEYLAMVVATEELSRGSLGVGGSLITRPEILTRALVKGGTEEQKHEWLPKLATGEIMTAVAVTEPDFGSDVAGIKVTATRRTATAGVINGVKTWCTFAARADVLMLLARTDPDRSRRPTAAFACSSCPRSGARATASSSPRTSGGKHGGPAPSTPSATAACTPTRWPSTTGSCPATTSSAATEGEGRGFYLQMEGFENGRLQTAARAVGVMQAAYEAAYDYAAEPGGVRPARSSTTSSPRPSSPAWP